MKDKDKTKEQLIKESEKLKKRITELGKAEREWKKAEEELQESDELKHLLMESFPNKIFFKDTASVYLFCNSYYAIDLGISPEEIRGKTDYDFFQRDLADKYRADDQRIMASGQLEQIEENYRIGDEERIVLTVKTPLRDANGSVIGILGIFTDITERKQTEEALQKSKERYKELWYNAPVAYHILDTKGIITNVNQTEAKMLGYTTEEMVGKSIFEFILPEQRTEARKRFRQKISCQYIPKVENRIYVRRDGSKVYVSVDDVLERDSKGEVVSIRTTMADITERIKAGEALRESEEQHRKVIENIFKFVPDGLLVFTDKLNLFTKNKTFQDIVKKYSAKLNYTEKELMEIIIEQVKNRIINKNYTEIRISKKQ